MSYDLRGAWEPVTGHHTTTRPHPEDDADTQLLTVVSISRALKRMTQTRPHLSMDVFHLVDLSFQIIDGAIQFVGGV